MRHAEPPGTLFPVEFRRSEVPLRGGNVSRGVVRVGDTVRRPAGPWTPTVHALLSHLRRAGFHGAPEPHGVDYLGREVLTFIPGVAAWPDHFDLLDTDAALRRVARLIRGFHDAAAEFTPPPDARWQALIPAEGTGIIAHHDLAPWNLIVNDRRWGLIDWDLAAPGSRLWDLAYAMHGFVPLSADPRRQRDDATHRLRVLADGYGLDQTQRRQIVPMLARRTHAMHAFLAGQHARGVQPWAGLWRQGHGAAWHADTEYIARHEHRWHRALLG